MHRFLRAVGFSNIKSMRELEPILGKIMNEPDITKKIELESKHIYTEFSMKVGNQIGITIRGEYDERGFFFLDHYFPYCESRHITTSENVIVNKRVDTQAFTGMCDDLRIGISIIFYLQNAVQYLELRSPDNFPLKSKLTLSGLSTKGVILLGVYYNSFLQEKHKLRQQRRNRLITRAKAGERSAIEDLTLDDFSTATKLRDRVRYRDVYSIVETTLIPYGSESDQYSIIGNIVNWSVIRNAITGEDVYQMLLNCNGFLITVCINKQDLLGEPMIGYRFKGLIWMQGNVNFEK